MGAGINLEFLQMFANDWHLLSDFSDFFLGAFVNSGSSRTVYEFKLDKKFVVKIDRSEFFNNVSEFDIWTNFKDTEFSRFLAPCSSISSCGRILMQERTEPITKEQLPELVPNFLSDTKIQNWGMLNGAPVCHDYANHKLFGGITLGMQPAKWWSDSYQLINEKSNT